MKNNDELRDELENSPFLKKMKAQPGEGFKVPKHYFEHLPDEVWKQLKQVPAPVPNRPGLLAQMEQFFLGLFQPRFALALVSVAVLVVLACLYFKDKNPVTTLPAVAQVRLEDVSDEELFAYVSNNIAEFDRTLMWEASGPEVPEMTPQPKASLPKMKAQKPNLEEIEEYLDDVIDEIDVEDLEEML